MTSKADKAIASPTKNFFVSMLTRDISLADAILDLVDNSLDGVLRVGGTKANYKKYWAKVSFNEKEFSIKDNCGGLDRKIATEYAFKMGRDANDQRDEDVETIGMYGIGMKRAMFKMGRDCRVQTHAKGGDHYRVVMDRRWLESRVWNRLALMSVPPRERLRSMGTCITVGDLHPGISATFKEPSFRKELMDSLGEHFTKFIQRGFRIFVNGVQIEPVLIDLLCSTANSGVKPYFMMGQSGGTTIRVAMGLNPRAKKDDGTSLSVTGWSVFCNNRAVLVGDTSRLTGWSDPPVPRYHDQYDILTGVVEFRSKDAGDLPVTTTKRDLDASSVAWLMAKHYMVLGTRKMISHTNAWKNLRSEHRKALRSAKAMTMEEVWGVFDSEPGQSLLRKKPGTDELVYNPDQELPKPSESASRNRRIVFSRPIGKIEQLGEALLDDANAEPKIVGQEAFDWAHRELVGRAR